MKTLLLSNLAAVGGEERAMNKSSTVKGVRGSEQGKRAAFDRVGFSHPARM